MIPRLWVDANVLLRFLTRDPEEQAERAAKLMAKAEEGALALFLTPLVIAEVIWTLKSFYQRSRQEIAEVLIPLLSAAGVEVEDRELTIRAVELTRDKNVDFGDALLALRAAEADESVCTFDRTDFKRLPVRWLSP